MGDADVASNRYTRSLFLLSITICVSPRTPSQEHRHTADLVSARRPRVQATRSTRFRVARSTGFGPDRTVLGGPNDTFSGPKILFSDHLFDPLSGPINIFWGRQTDRFSGCLSDLSAARLSRLASRSTRGLEPRQAPDHYLLFCCSLRLQGDDTSDAVSPDSGYGPSAGYRRIWLGISHGHNIDILYFHRSSCCPSAGRRRRASNKRPM